MSGLLIGLIKILPIPLLVGPSELDSVRGRDACWLLLAGDVAHLFRGLLALLLEHPLRLLIVFLETRNPVTRVCPVVPAAADLMHVEPITFT
jgi:hypothetical protein